MIIQSNISGNIGVKPGLFKRSKDLLGRLHRVGTIEIRTISRGAQTKLKNNFAL